MVSVVAIFSHEVYGAHVAGTYVGFGCHLCQFGHFSLTLEYARKEVIFLKLDFVNVDRIHVDRVSSLGSFI